VIHRSYVVIQSVQAICIRPLVRRAESSTPVASASNDRLGVQAWGLHGGHQYKITAAKYISPILSSSLFSVRSLDNVVVLVDLISFKLTIKFKKKTNSYD